jgi:hypothetical protein
MQQVFRVALPRNLQGAIDYMGGGVWRLWLHTSDFVNGTYITLFSDGKITRTTVREDEGDEVVVIKEA